MKPSGVSHGVRSVNSTRTREENERTLAPCNVAGVGWQTKAAQHSSFPLVIQAIIFKATLTESLLFQKATVQAFVGPETLKRSPQGQAGIP